MLCQFPVAEMNEYGIMKLLWMRNCGEPINVKWFLFLLRSQTLEPSIVCFYHWGSFVLFGKNEKDYGHAFRDLKSFEKNANCSRQRFQKRCEMIAYLGR